MKYELLVATLLISTSVPAQTTPETLKPVGKIELVQLLATGSSTTRISSFVKNRGIDFTPDEFFLNFLADDGMEAPLLAEIKSARVVNRNSPSTGAEAGIKELAVLGHLHRAARLNPNNFHPRAAEPEFRAAVAADPTNPFAHLALGKVLLHLHQVGDAAAESRTALAIQPDLAEAHLELGRALESDPAKTSEALAELRRAADLAPYDSLAQYLYASALLGTEGDKEEAKKRSELIKKFSGTEVVPRVRIGGQVQKAKVIFRPSPQYPAAARAERIQGAVRMDVLIGREGTVEDLEILSGEPILAQAAAEAVRKWRYQPTLLNHDPVEVVTEIEVHFTLAE